MAAKGKKPSGAVEIPECPVCLEPMSAPIFLCASGHSLCSACTQALCPSTCPICRQPMTQMRNRSLEEIIGKVTEIPEYARGDAACAVRARRYCLPTWPIRQQPMTQTRNRSLEEIICKVTEIPEYASMSVPIFLCALGHSLCSACTQALCPPTCPICRQPMTQMRNCSLEEIIAKAKTPCPNRALGCVYSLPGEALAAHAAECLFRPRECPHAVFGKCSWTGDLKKLMEHFKEKHSAACVPSVDSDAGWRLEVNDLELKECERHVYLAAQQNFLFIVTFKVDTIQRMAYWTIQHIGQKKVARQHIYEIHITSKRDPQRKVVFTEYCFNDTMKAEEIFRQSNCAVLPLDMLAHFVQDKKLSFRFNIKRLSVQNKENEDKEANPAHAPRSHFRPRDTSQCSETRGQGPKPHWKKHPGQKGPGPKKSTKT